ncbi:hypothetical protein GCM10023195_01600 [Actinoallomurus liliacearum]|uniref:Uncharacterized protein n=1 Tax=Actinoallomurus liliacearum TaxID=1080073 RepID=A0ABP8TC75_9ACTN
MPQRARRTTNRRAAGAGGRLEDLLGKPRLLAELKSDPGPLGLDTLLVEIGKLTTVRSLGLGEEVFAEVC